MIRSEREKVCNIKPLIVDIANKRLTIQGVSLVGTCDVADMVRLETLTTDNGTLVGGHRVAEANMVRDRRANISVLRKESSKWDSVDIVGVTKTWEAETNAEKDCSSSRT